ncbi:MAG: DUF1801 domain-containing protein [Candidatus Lokiarchaeota archaeon]|nr:DUF1801 domain-containing protein [Candidatus Lokiarchaeota archaeon]
MTELKTKPTKKSVGEFLKKVEYPTKREDCKTILNLMKEITKEEPVMWGDSIVGFGSYHYKYASGREGDWFLVGFSPRKQNLTIYLMSGFEKYKEILNDLGKFRTGKSCLYINKLNDINMQKLRELVSESVKHLKSSDS